ncbi:hypothetical protein MTO96_026313 [Rhipicephalus appendiculatus]
MVCSMMVTLTGLEGLLLEKSHSWMCHICCARQSVFVQKQSDTGFPRTCSSASHNIDCTKWDFRDCVFPDVDLDATLTSVISQLTKHEEYIHGDVSSYKGLFDVECCNVTGLQFIRPYGPLLPHCVNGSSKVQVDLVSSVPIEVAMKWRTFTGKEGTLVLGAQLSRFTLQFEVVERPSENSTTLRLEDPVVPVATEITYTVVDCVFADLNLDGALKAVITQLSKYEEHVHVDTSSYRNLLVVECCNVTGLSHHRQYGPLLPYCVNGTRKLQVDLLHDDPIEVAMNWWTYGGIAGTLVLGADLSRFTLQFEVVARPSGNSTALRMEEPVVPVVTQGTYAVVGNVGEIARTATEFWSDLLPSVTEHVWKYYFFQQLRLAIRQTERNLFSPLLLATTTVTNAG